MLFDAHNKAGDYGSSLEEMNDALFCVSDVPCRQMRSKTRLLVLNWPIAVDCHHEDPLTER